MTTRPGLLTPDNHDAAWRTEMERLLAQRRRQCQLIPAVAHPVHPSTVNGTLNGWWAQRFLAPTGGFVPVWATLIPTISHRELLVTTPVGCGTGAEAKVRIRMTAAGGIDIVSPDTADFTSPADFFEFFWLHGLTPWTTTNVTAAVEANVITASGGSPADVFIPYGGAILQREPFSAVV